MRKAIAVIFGVLLVANVAAFGLASARVSPAAASLFEIGPATCGYPIDAATQGTLANVSVPVGSALWILASAPYPEAVKNVTDNASDLIHTWKNTTFAGTAIAWIGEIVTPLATNLTLTFKLMASGYLQACAIPVSGANSTPIVTLTGESTSVIVNSTAASTEGLFAYGGSSSTASTDFLCTVYPATEVVNGTNAIQKRAVGGYEVINVVNQTFPVPEAGTYDVEAQHQCVTGQSTTDGVDEFVSFSVPAGAPPPSGPSTPASSGDVLVVVGALGLLIIAGYFLIRGVSRWK